VNQGNKPDEDEKTDKQEEDEFSYPVGMVDELNLFPMDFEEFLWATGNDILSQEIRSHYEANEALPASVHSLALDLYQKYLVVGGMPESVQKWVDTHSYLECRTVQQSILVGYNADMAKYAKPGTTVKIRACFNSIPAQLAKENRKFQYKLAMKGGTAKIFGEAIEWLILAGTVHKCKLITHGFIPISAQEDDSDFKIYMSDVGLLNTKTQMPVQMLLNAIETDNTFLGSVAENYVGQALAANGIALRYWKNDNTQEVEFILQDGMNVIPVEVKKGKKVDAISLNNFKKTYNCPYAYRISGKNFGFANGIKAVPLYAVFCIEANGDLE
jgi:predicted AAA+ superfamily ATPase